MTERSAKDLLPDLPDEEPWLELRFQLRELDWDLRGIIARFQECKALLGVKEHAQKLAGSVSQLYFDVDHDAQAHAPRAVQLARCLLTMPPESVPEWGDMAGATRAEFEIPLEIKNCTSLEQAQGSLAWHLDEAVSVVSQAHEAALRAAAVRGSRMLVLEQVLKEATLCCRLLQEQAWLHAEKAYQWSQPYWRLMDPTGAAEHDTRAAAARTEAEAELADLDPARGTPQE
jgi:hypothetical protein